MKNGHLPKIFFAVVFFCFFNAQTQDMKTKYKPTWENVTFEKLEAKYRAPKTNWTFVVYMAADNDLFEFAFRDLEEMAKVGSNQNVSIIVQLDGYGAHEKTKRLYIAQGKIYEVENPFENAKLDSGSDQTLIDCMKWAIDDYPADHYALILWNHGSGVLDPTKGRPFRAAGLFIENAETGMMEIDRSINYMDLLERRGICFSDTHGTFLTNQKLEKALREITTYRGKKLDVIAFDACLMAMLEIAESMRFYADYMVGSQEVEPGDGWGYHETLAPLAEGYVEPFEFARHAVESYRLSYLRRTPEFTQSAFDLKNIHTVLDNVHRVSTILMKLTDFQLEGTIDRAVEMAKDSRFCTHFSEPNYIDLKHFYENLRLIIPFVHLEDGHTALIDQLDRTLEAGIKLIEKVVIANVRGTGLPHASGLAIYFPGSYIHPSYEKTFFGKENAWMELLQYFTR
jgi:hypothetical protein